jgi:Tfp pilus assembly protein PilN
VPLRKEAGELENDFTKIAVVRGYLANRGFALEVLTEIFNTIPLEVEVNYLKFDGQGKLTIRGTAASMSVIFAFVDNLEKSSYFKDVKTKYTTMRKEGIKDLADFEIGCTLESSES